MAAASSGDDILTRICRKRLEDVAAAEAKRSLRDTRAACLAAALPAVQNLGQVLDSRTGLVVAAEFKRASPSKGVIASRSVTEQVSAYCQGGATVLSVLTEPHWFQGSLDDLTAARKAADACHASGAAVERPLVLRKDFVVSPYQIYEARLHGADTVLLIVAWLETAGRVKEMLDVCHSLGMEPFVEVASLEELDVALEAGARVVGVNNRNLRTFEVDPDMTARVASKAAGLGRLEGLGRLHLFAFSGIKGADHVRELRASLGAPGWVSGVLVGEHLMRAPDPAGEVSALLSAWDGSSERHGVVETALQLREAMGGRVLAKVCGLTSAGDALDAARAGASFVGMILCPGTPRSVAAAEARSVTDAIKAFRETDASSLLARAAPAGAAALPLAARTWTLVRAARRSRPLAVGVFRDQAPAEVAAIAADAGVDVVQLHGKEDASDAEWLAIKLPIIKVIHVTVDGEGSAGGDRASEATEGGWDGIAAALLLDTKVPGSKGGGTGVSFDWTLAQSVHAPVGVAGGLAAATVPEAARQGGGWLLDVSSGVESAPGTKDRAKVQAFCEAVAACELS